MANYVHGNQLPLERCPHCGIARPSLHNRTSTETTNHAGGNKRFWRIYSCQSCGGAILAGAKDSSQHIVEMYPTGLTADNEAIPERAREYFVQAVASIHAPAGAIMLTASTVDAMLKAKGYRDGSLYERIDAAAEAGLITAEMAAWAHEIRLDANDQRHADEEAPLPDPEEASKCVEFARALAEFLFILPARVARGRAAPTRGIDTAAAADRA